jgi:hypothetical protein
LAASSTTQQHASNHEALTLAPHQAQSNKSFEASSPATSHTNPTVGAYDIHELRGSAAAAGGPLGAAFHDHQEFVTSPGTLVQERMKMLQSQPQHYQQQQQHRQQAHTNNAHTPPPGHVPATVSKLQQVADSYRSVDTPVALTPSYSPAGAHNSMNPETHGQATPPSASAGASIQEHRHVFSEQPQQHYRSDYQHTIQYHVAPFHISSLTSPHAQPGPAKV